MTFWYERIQFFVTRIVSVFMFMFDLFHVRSTDFSVCFNLFSFSSDKTI